MHSSQEATDRAMMARCIELSRIAVSKGEYPFATVVALEGQVVAEAINGTIREDDVSRHAEVIALSEARKAIGRHRLRLSTLYTNIEPCAMCSYCIREARVGRVAYSIASPVMGGLSKWNILRDDGISGMPQIFGPVPAVVSGILFHEAQQVWRDWNPLAWQMIKLRGLLTKPCAHDGQIQDRPPHAPSLWQSLQMLFARTSQPPAAKRVEVHEGTPLPRHDLIDVNRPAICSEGVGRPEGAFTQTVGLRREPFED